MKSFILKEHRVIKPQCKKGKNVACYFHNTFFFGGTWADKRLSLGGEGGGRRVVRDTGTMLLLPSTLNCYEHGVIDMA